MISASSNGISGFSSCHARQLIIIVCSVMCHSVMTQIHDTDGGTAGNNKTSPTAGREWTKPTGGDSVRTSFIVSADNGGTGAAQPPSTTIQREDAGRKRRSLFDMFRKIYPGTKWCGAGDIAEHDDDRGRYKDTDSCCYQHDQCQLTLSPGEERYGIKNPKSYTVSSCECDEKFSSCLQGVSSFVSFQVGNLFFNIIKVPCLEMDPSEERGRLVSCKSYSQKRPTLGQVFTGQATFGSWLGGIFGRK